MICPVRYFILEVKIVNSSKKVRALVESAMMVALATVLSVFKIIEMPYGGSVTIASMLPMIILAYRHGALWGIGSGGVYAVLQQLLGLNTLSYVTGWQSVVAVITLDYILAFTLVGLGGIFRRMCKTQSCALVSGAALVTLLRYVCHVISGATVWAGLSIPDGAALIYSIGYNATYMLPEAIILIAVSHYIGCAVDFSKPIPERAVTQHRQGDYSLNILGGLSFLLALVVDVWLIAPNLQDEETGEFILQGLQNVEWIAVGIVSVLAAAIGTALLVISKRNKRN